MRNWYFLLVAALLGACTVDQNTANEVLGDEGYHNVRLTGYAAFSCSEDDTFRSGFVAYRTILDSDGTPHEREVTGTLCCGWLKDCTVRHR